MNQYDKTKIGKIIGWGGEHIVREYGDDQVIKFSGLYLCLGSMAEEKALKDKAVCKQFFGKYILDTELAISAGGTYLVQIQPKIVGHFLCKQDLEDPNVLEQFKEIAQGYRTLTDSTGAVIDLLGRGGVFNKCLSNIFVTPEKKLFIIDATLLEIKGFLKPIGFVIGKFAKWRQERLIKFFLS